VSSMTWVHWLGLPICLASVSALAGPVAPVAPAAQATPAASVPTTARDTHTAECVAALDVSTREFAEQIRNGRDAVRPLLLARLRSGAAFIGSAYLAGERDPARTKALLEAALEAQKRLPKADLEALQVACEVEGSRLLGGASALERAVVGRIADKRMQKLLSK